MILVHSKQAITTLTPLTNSPHKGVEGGENKSIAQARRKKPRTRSLDQVWCLCTAALLAQSKFVTKQKVINPAQEI